MKSNLIPHLLCVGLVLALGAGIELGATEARPVGFDLKLEPAAHSDLPGSATVLELGTDHRGDLADLCLRSNAIALRSVDLKYCIACHRETVAASFRLPVSDRRPRDRPRLE